MSPHELAAFRAGVRQSAEWELVTALTLELRPDAGKLRQQAAIEALRGLAEALKTEVTAMSATPTTEAEE